MNLAVLLIFFNRPDSLKQVFEQVRKAKPSKLFLACDGARENNLQDIEKIAQCKAVVSDIDWDCEVFKDYSDVNLGCGVKPYSAITNAFKNTDSLVILEDDCIPNPTFFPYMAEMLEYYKNDTRIGILSGYNHFKYWDCGDNSYFFTKTGATLGWATWKRVWNNYDYYLKEYQNDYTKKIVCNEVIHKKAKKRRQFWWDMTVSKNQNRVKLSWWDHQFGFIKYSQSLLMVVPKNNLIFNIGIGEDSTHAKHISSTKWKIGDVCFMPTQDMEFPLKHPKCVVCDREYDNKYFSLIAYPNIFNRVKTRLKWILYK